MTTTSTLIGLKDRTIVELLMQIDENLKSIPDASAVLSKVGASTRFGDDGRPSAECSIETLCEQDDLKAAFAQDGELVAGFNAFWRRSDGFGAEVSFSRNATGAVDSRIQIPEDQVGRELSRLIQVAIMGPISRYRLSAALADINPQLNAFHQERIQATSRIEEAHSRILTHAAEKLLDQERAFSEKLDSLERDWKEKKGELDREHAAMVARLEVREATVLDREKAVDASTSRDARREIQRGLRAEFRERKQKFSLTKATEEKRNPISWACYGAMVLTGSAFGVFVGFPDLFGKDLPSWVHMVKVSASLATFLSTILYFVRWQDQWQKQHAAEEFRLQRLELDMERASWLVETVMESSVEGSNGIPVELLNRLAQGLFEDVGTMPSTRHPAEELLAGLLSTPREMKVDFPGGSAAFNQRGLKELMKND